MIRKVKSQKEKGKSSIQNLKFLIVILPFAFLLLNWIKGWGFLK